MTMESGVSYHGHQHHRIHVSNLSTQHRNGFLLLAVTGNTGRTLIWRAGKWPALARRR